MKKFFQSIIPWIARIVPAGKFSSVTFWRHSENKFVYLCMSEKYMKTDEGSTGEEKFLEVFPKAIRISKFEFDVILFFFPDMQLINVADDNLIEMIGIGNEIPRPEVNEGAYAEDEHEESEDQNLIKE